MGLENVALGWASVAQQQLCPMEEEHNSGLFTQSAQLVDLWTDFRTFQEVDPQDWESDRSMGRGEEVVIHHVPLSDLCA